MAGLYTSSDCAAAHLVPDGSAFDLTSPVQDGGVTLFRVTLYVRVPVDDRCQALVVAPGSGLQARFDSTTVQVTRSSAWVTTWHQDDSAHVTVHLAYPAPIVTVQSDVYGKVDLHRVDGDAVSDKPTVTNQDTGRALPQPFVAPAFQAAFSQAIPQRMSSVIQSRRDAQQMRRAQSLSAAAVQDRIRTGDEVYDEMTLVAIAEAALGGLVLGGQPTTPRLRLMSPDRSESLWQWVQPGEHASIQASELVGQLQPALDRALALRKSGDTQLVLPLLVESDAPCRVTLQQADLAFLLQADLIAQPVQVSLPGGSEQTRSISLQAPAVQSQRLDLQASIALRDPSAAGEPAALGDGRLGVALDPGMRAAALWQPDRSYWLIGLAIAWYGLSDHAALKVALLPQAGGPSAATGSLAEASLDVSAAGPGWLRFHWQQVAVQPGAYWVRLQVAEGSGLWLGSADQDLHPLWQQTPPAAGSVSSVPLAPLHFALEPVAAAPPPVRLTLNGAALTGSSPQPDIIAAGMETPAVLAAPSPWRLDVTSASALSFTLKSARLSYLD